MNITEEARRLVVDLNEFVKTLDENIRAPAFQFLLGASHPDARSGVTTPVLTARTAENRDVSPQELIRQSKVSSGIAKAEVLGYWLEMHRAKESFSSGDLKEAFAYAREPAPRNASDVVAKLASTGKLMATEKSGAVQYYRLTRTAIDEVRAWLQT